MNIDDKRDIDSFFDFADGIGSTLIWTRYTDDLASSFFKRKISATVASTSCVFVVVILWMKSSSLPPIVKLPTRTGRVFDLCSHFTHLFLSLIGYSLITISILAINRAKRQGTALITIILYKHFLFVFVKAEA